LTMLPYHWESTALRPRWGLSTFLIYSGRI